MVSRGRFVPGPLPARKTSSDGDEQSERTASENKERAYIAASRRSDRSLEARVQSAFAASQIHKERTGKALKVTEEIVLREEMYEEEDDLPARYQALMNNPLFALSPRAEAYAITQMGMRDAMAARFSNGEPSTRLDEVNRQFAQVFPGFGMPPQQTPLSDPRVAQHGQTVPGSHPPFTHSTPAQAIPSCSPATQTQQPAFPHTSPQSVAYNSPFVNPASQGDSPISAHPMLPGDLLSSPILGPSMHARSMSLSQVEPALRNAHRATPISPSIPPQFQQVGLRRSYDEAFSNSQSPLTTPTFPGAYTMSTALCSPGMPPRTGPPATYNGPPSPYNGQSSPYNGQPIAHNTNMQRRATAHPIAMSPGGLHPMQAAGLTTQLPPNVMHFIQHPRNGDRSASFPGAQQGLYTSPHTGPPMTQGPNFVPHAGLAQFQLQSNPCQVQREKKERKRRSRHDIREAFKYAKAAETKTKAKPKEATKPTPYPSVERAEPAALVPTNNQKITNGPPTRNLATASQDGQSQAVQPFMDTQNDSNMGFPDYNFEDMEFDVNTFQGFDPNLATLNMNLDDNFMNDFFTFPASQPENDNAQAVS